MAEEIQSGEIGIIILAAGSSLRFSSDKRLSKLDDGRTLLETTLAVIPSQFNKRILVLGSSDELLAEEVRSLDSTNNWQIVFAQDAVKGLGHSLAAGIIAAKNWAGAIIGLADMPLVQKDTYLYLQAALTQHEIVVPVYGGRKGNPVGFRQKYFSEISKLEEDKGAKALLEKYRSDCLEFQSNDQGILRDIDTQADLENLNRI